MYKLDIKDKKILTQLDINSRQSNNQIGNKVGLSKEVVKYRIDKLIEEGVIIQFHTVINYFKLGIVKFKLYLRLTNVNEEKLNEMGKYFYDNPKTEWVVLTSGRWDLISGFLVKNVNEFDDEVQAILGKFTQHIQEKAVTTTLYLAHESKEFIKEDNKRKIKVEYHTSKDKQEKIDKVDLEILKIIAKNARMPITEIAKKVKVTPRIVQYRLKELENKKIILAYRVLINPKSIGEIFCKAIIYLSNSTKNRLDAFITYASSIQGAIC